MSFKGYFLVVIVFLFGLSFFGSILLGNVKAAGDGVVVTESDARLAIEAAEERIVVCYQVAAEADKAGANVTGLLAVLNEAGWFLSRAKLTYKMGDFESAINFASLSQEKLNGFVEEADGLRGTAMQQRYWDFMVNVVGSIIGTVAVICGSLVAWFLLKRKYGKAGNVV